MRTDDPIEVDRGTYLTEGEPLPIEYDALATCVKDRLGEVPVFYADDRGTAAELTLGDAVIRVFHPRYADCRWLLERVDANIPETTTAQVSVAAPIERVVLAAQRLAADEHVAVVERVIDALFDNIELAGLAEDAFLSEHAAPVTDTGEPVYATTLTYADAGLMHGGRGVILSFSDGAEVRVSITLHSEPNRS